MIARGATLPICSLSLSLSYCPRLFSNSHRFSLSLSSCPHLLSKSRGFSLSLSSCPHLLSKSRGFSLSCCHCLSISSYLGLFCSPRRLLLSSSSGLLHSLRHLMYSALDCSQD